MATILPRLELGEFILARDLVFLIHKWAACVPAERILHALSTVSGREKLVREILGQHHVALAGDGLEPQDYDAIQTACDL